MKPRKHTVKEVIFEFEEDPNGGFTAWADADDGRICTQGETWNELRKNMKEAATCYYGRGCKLEILVMV